MQRPASTRAHDPFWDLDGAAARRSRLQKRVFRAGLMALAILFLAVVATRLPAFDPQLITNNGSLRPVLAVALLALLACCVLVGAARIRTTSSHG